MICSNSHLSTDPKYATFNICQIMYPAEYNVYGIGSSPVMSFKKSASGNWKKHFYIKDYLGSTRKVWKLNQDYQTYVWISGTWLSWQDGTGNSLIGNTNFNSYNDRYSSNNRISTEARLGWLGLERDLESGLGDHGVRKYSNETGRFLSVDPLPQCGWEKYLSWTPYQYPGNNPVNAVEVIYYRTIRLNN